MSLGGERSGGGIDDGCREERQAARNGPAGVERSHQDAGEVVLDTAHTKEFLYGAGKPVTFVTGAETLFE
jgi:hypothetical protein